MKDILNTPIAELGYAYYEDDDLIAVCYNGRCRGVMKRRQSRVSECNEETGDNERSELPILGQVCRELGVTYYG